MESMSMNLTIPSFKEGPKTRKIIKRFSSAIERLLKEYDEGGELILSNPNLLSSKSKERGAWMLEMKIGEFWEHNEARKDDIMAMERSHGVWTRLSQEEARLK